MAGCSREQIIEMAEQLLLGSKTWQDFAWLSDDDRGRVKALVDRGAKALGERGQRQQTPQAAVQHALRQARDHHGTFIARRRRPQFLSQATGIQFSPFDYSILCHESEGVRRLVFEAIQRRLQSAETALWISCLPDDAWQALMEALPLPVVEEWEHRVGMLPEDIAAYERDSVQAKSALLTLNALQDADAVHPETQSALKDYRAQLEVALHTHCEALPQRMGLLEHLRGFSNTQWTKLAGFTPREDMGCFMEFLPDDVAARLTHPLPARQKEVVAEAMALHQRKRREDLRAWGDVMQALKQWMATVSQVVHLTVEVHEGD